MSKDRQASEIESVQKPKRKKKSHSTKTNTQRALQRVRKALDIMTDEEDAAITADALADPDNPPADDLLARQPATSLGRPRSNNPKQPVSIRLDADVIKYFKSTGSGWQSRINDALRKAAKLPKAG